MPLKAPRVRKDALFKRKGVKVWQARVWIDGKAIRRSTGARVEKTALEILPSLRAHLERLVEKAGNECPPPDAINPLLIH